ncbi:MAG: hypothetical protein AAFS10_24175 [Myxococcota bacterium]
MIAAAGCIDDESIFTEGRIENLCNSNIPACNSQASCVLGGGDFYRGIFPGGVRALVRTEDEQTRLVVRFLLTEPIFPGTELLVQINTPDCSDLNEEHPRDIDLFQLAGDDRTLEFQLDMEGRGDHLLEIFSDMSAAYLMTVEVEQR